MTFDRENNGKEPILQFKDAAKLHTAKNNLNIIQASSITGIPVRLLEIFRSEEHWDLAPEAPPDNVIPVKLRGKERTVGLREITCPVCEGTDYVEVPQIGRLTGLRISTLKRCICSAFKLYHSRWSNPKNVPTMYQDAEYFAFFFPNEIGERLRARIFHGAFKDEVKLILNTIEKFSDAGYLLTGKGGCGKSTLACAMYQRDLQAWALQTYDSEYVESVWKVSAKTLADEFQAWALRFNTEEKERRKNQNDGETTSEPTVTVDKIQRAVNAGLTPCLYLEEIDKFKNSDFQLTQFHSIIDAIQTNGGRVIATSNLQIEYLSARFDEQFAEACIRRICGAPKGVHIEFTSQNASIHINYPDDENPGLPYNGRAGNVEGKKLALTVERSKDLKHKVVSTVEMEIKSGVEHKAEVPSERKLSNASSVPPPKTQAQSPSTDAASLYSSPPKRRSVHRG